MISKKMSSTRAFLASIELLKVRNFDLAAFFSASNIPVDVCKQLDNQIALEKLLRWMECAKRHMNDDALGLHAGEVIHPGCFGEMGLALLCCESMQQVSKFGIEFSRLMGDAAGARVIRDKDKVSYTEHWPDCSPESVKSLVEQNMVATITFGKRLVTQGDQVKLRPLEVSFRHAQPAYVAEYYRIFQCPIHFKQPYNAISFDPSIAKCRVVSASPELHATIRSRLEKTKWEILNTGFCKRVHHYVEEELSNHMPSIIEVAEHFNMNSKSLQRRLKNEDTTYRDLCQDLRRTYATEWVGKSNRSFTDISNTLGYSCLSAFTRAFKEWFGVPPFTYREQQVLEHAIDKSTEHSNS